MLKRGVGSVFRNGRKPIKDLYAQTLGISEGLGVQVPLGEKYIQFNHKYASKSFMMTVVNRINNGVLVCVDDSRVCLLYLDWQTLRETFCGALALFFLFPGTIFDCGAFCALASAKPPVLAVLSDQSFEWWSCGTVHNKPFFHQS